MKRPPSPPSAGRGPDAESQEWLDALSGTGDRHDDAIERLHELLLRAARFELARRRRASPAAGRASSTTSRRRPQPTR